MEYESIQQTSHSSRLLHHSSVRAVWISPRAAVINVRLTDVDRDRPVCCCGCCFPSKACPARSCPTLKYTPVHMFLLLMQSEQSLCRSPAPLCSCSRSIISFFFPPPQAFLYICVCPPPLSLLGCVNKLVLWRPWRVPPPPAPLHYNLHTSKSHACSDSDAALRAAGRQRGDAQMIHWAIVTYIVRTAWDKKD